MSVSERLGFCKFRQAVGVRPANCFFYSSTKKNVVNGYVSKPFATAFADVSLTGAGRQRVRGVFSYFRHAGWYSTARGRTSFQSTEDAITLV